MNTHVVKNDRNCGICGKPFDVKYTLAGGEKLYSSCYVKLRTIHDVELHHICPTCANRMANLIKELKCGITHSYLKGKCGSCIYSEPTTFGKSKVYVRCTNEEHLKTYCARPASDVRQRTQPACKSYKSRE
jgi:hypothetical protein